MDTSIYQWVVEPVPQAEKEIDSYCVNCLNMKDGECIRAFKGEVPGYFVNGKIVACADKIIMCGKGETNND